MPLIKYQGPQPLPLELDLPIPYLSKAEWAGTVTFNPTADVDEKTAEFLLAECGDAFVSLDPVKPSPEPVSIPAEIPQANPWLELAKGKFFPGKAGKWNAKAFIKKHHLDGLVELHRVPNGWQLEAVPAQAEGQNPPIPVMAGGLTEEQDDNGHASH